MSTKWQTGPARSNSISRPTCVCRPGRGGISVCLRSRVGVVATAGNATPCLRARIFARGWAPVLDSRTITWFDAETRPLLLSGAVSASRGPSAQASRAAVRERRRGRGRADRAVVKDDPREVVLIDRLSPRLIVSVALIVCGASLAALAACTGWPARTSAPCSPASSTRGSSFSSRALTRTSDCRRRLDWLLHADDMEQ
jgi:hypothetical protein